MDPLFRLDPTYLFYILVFIIPGFVVQSTMAMFAPQRTTTAQNTFMRALFFSCLNYSLWSWLTYPVPVTNLNELWPLIGGLQWILVMFISPALLGLIFAKLGTKRLIPTIHMVPTSWDYKFFKTQHPVYVKIRLKNGEQILGYFGTGSFASSDDKERDIYLEKICDLDSNGEWQMLVESDGILIDKNEIAYIQFYQINTRGLYAQDDTGKARLSAN